MRVAEKKVDYGQSEKKKKRWSGEGEKDTARDEWNLSDGLREEM